MPSFEVYSFSRQLIGSQLFRDPLPENNVGDNIISCSFGRSSTVGVILGWSGIMEGLVGVKFPCPHLTFPRLIACSAKK